MTIKEEASSSSARFPAVRRKPVRLSTAAVVSTGYLAQAEGFPLVFKPTVEGVNLAEWAAANHAELEAHLLKHGALLFRGFAVNAPNHLEQLIQATCGHPLEYNERSSPRSQVSGNIYTSTDYPPDESIFLHNEQSYNATFPLRIFFFCTKPAAEGGETPIADTRKIYERLSPEVRQGFVEKKYMYVRNFGQGFGLSWQTAFQTTDRREVEDYCRRNDIKFEWKDGDRLRTQQVRRAVASHPRTGERVWFNHLTFFHFSTLSASIQETLSSLFGEEDLPNNTYYGDGSAIEPEVLDELRAAYLQEQTTFSWQQGDILMLDNMLASHGRASYSGPREVLVGMAEPFNWEGISIEN
jgi:alpha-ketoglutarate-dependent taurine dioxygenase